MRSGGFTSGSSNDKDAMVRLFLLLSKTSIKWSMFVSDVIATRSLQANKPVLKNSTKGSCLTAVV